MRVVRSSDGLVMREMHDELSKTGRTGSTTGLIRVCRMLGFIGGAKPAAGTKPAPAKRRAAQASPAAGVSRRCRTAA